MSDEAEPQTLAEAIEANAANPPTFEEIPDGQRPGFAPEQAAPAEGPSGTPPAPEAAPQPEPPASDPYAAYGGQAAVESALGISSLLRTESGVRMMIAEGLTKLGKNPADVQAFMEGKLTLQQVEESAPANPWDNLTEDDVIDGAQAKDWFNQVKTQAVAEAQAAAQAAMTAAITPLQQQNFEQLQERAGQTSDATIIELLGENGDPKTVDVELAGRVLAAANQYVQEGNWDPSHIRAAVIQGHHDVVKTAELAQRAYLTAKARDAAGAPGNIGGAQAVGGEEQTEPQSREEASKLAKALYGW